MVQSIRKCSAAVEVKRGRSHAFDRFVGNVIAEQAHNGAGAGVGAI
jgi:hypothetical protein